MGKKLMWEEFSGLPGIIGADFECTYGSYNQPFVQKGKIKRVILTDVHVFFHFDKLENARAEAKPEKRQWRVIARKHFFLVRKDTSPEMTGPMEIGINAPMYGKCRISLVKVETRLEKLIIVRHGDYGPDDHLDSRGKKQMSDLAPKLKEIIGNSAGSIFASPTDRARESGEILAAILCLPLKCDELLWSENSHPMNLPGVLDLIRSQSGLGVLILVIHLEYADHLPGYFVEKGLGGRAQLVGGLKKGEACVVQCDQKIICRIQ